jgi:hypothetical protein
MKRKRISAALIIIQLAVVWLAHGAAHPLRSHSIMATSSIDAAWFGRGEWARAIIGPIFTGEPAVALPEARVNADYRYQFQAEGGLAPLNWRIVEGVLPAGVRLDASGLLSGKPTQARSEAYRFIVEVNDSSPTPQRQTQAISLIVIPAPLRITMGQPQNSTGLRIVSLNETKSVAQPSDASLDAAANSPAKKNDAGPSPAPSGKNAVNAANAPGEFTVSGRLRPASLDEVFAIIQSDESAMSVEGVRSLFCQAGFSEHCSPGDSDLKNRKSARVATIDLLKKLSGDSDTSFRKILDKDEKSTKEVSQLIGEGKYRSRYINKDTIDRLLYLLTSRIAGFNVQVEDNTGKLVGTTFTDHEGDYTIKLAESQPGSSYVLSTDADNHHAKVKFFLKGEDLKISIPIEDRPVSLLTRAVVGYQQAGAASTDFEQNYFFDLFVSQSLPFRQRVDPNFGERWKTWGAIRAISAPQSGDVSIGELGGNFVTKVSALKANEAARVFDYLGGLEVRLPFTVNGALLPSFDRDTRQKSSLSLILSGGFVTPSNPAQTVRTFRISEQFRTRFKQEAPFGKEFKGDELDGKDYVSFVQSDRDRFFRQYYVGLRMQTFFFNRISNVPLQRFPIQLDVMYGVNEYVTAGRAKGGVMRFDGYFPLPYDKLSFINLFGTAIVRPVRSNIKAPTILEAVEDAKQFDPKTVMIPVSQFSRDYYRVGVGIDFVSFIGKLIRNN